MTIRQLALSLVVSASVALPSLAPAVGGEAIRFAPLPLEDKKIIHEQFRGLVAYLEERSRHTFTWVQLDDYAEILQGFQANDIDLAYLGPLPYAILKRDDPDAEALSCFRDSDGKTSYTCSLVTSGASELTPATVVDSHIGLTQPYSTCGYLSVTEMLVSAGRRIDSDSNRFSYAGSHSKAALGVARGEYDIAGVKTTIAERYAHLDLKIVATSRSYPGFTLVANRSTLNDETITQIRNALLELDPTSDPQIASRMDSWGRQIRQGTVPIDQCDYKAVSDALEVLPWPIPQAQP